MAIADPDEPKKDGGKTLATGLTQGSSVSALTDTVCKKTSTLRRGTPMRCYSKIKDFSFSIPEGWPDSAIVTFLNCCKENIEDLKNHSDDENKWCNIATSGGEITKRLDCFTVNNCIELGQSLKHFVTKYKDRNDNDEDFKQLHVDIIDLLPYFPPVDAETKKTVVQSRSKSSETKVEPVLTTTDPHIREVALENQIICIGKQYSGLFGAKGSTPDYIWREMSRKVGQKLGLKIDVREHLEAKKRQIALEVQQVTDPVERENKFLLLAKDYISYFDYIPPRKIKISDFCLSQRGQLNHSEEDTDIATDATVELTEEEGDMDNQNNDFQALDVKIEKELLVSVKKEKIEENVFGNDQVVTPIEIEPTIKGKRKYRKKRTSLEMMMSDQEGDFIVPVMNGKLDPAFSSQSRKETLRSKKNASNASVEDKDEELVENGDLNDGLKKRKIGRKKLEPINAAHALPKKTFKDKTEKTLDTVVNEDQIESMKNTATKTARQWARGRKRKVVPEESENNKIPAEEEAKPSEITSPRQSRYLSRAKFKIPDSEKSVKTSSKELVDNDTEENNECIVNNDVLKNKINIEPSHSLMLDSPKILSSNYFVKSDCDKIRKNPFVRLSPVPDSLSQLIRSQGEPITVRIQPHQMSSAKLNQETKKIPSKPAPRAKAKLMEERVAVPKDVVQYVYNPSSDSAKTKVARPATTSRNTGKTNKTNSKDEKFINKPNNSKMMSKEGKTSSNRPNKTNNVWSKDDKLPTKAITQLDLNRVHESERSRSQRSSDESKKISDLIEKEASLMQLLPANAIPHSSSYPSHPNFLPDTCNALPPKWFEGFTHDYKKHEAWKIGQLMKIQSELISMEKKKLAVLQNILCTLNSRR